MKLFIAFALYILSNQIYAGIETGGGTATRPSKVRFHSRDAIQSYFISLLELEKYFTIENIRTIEGEVITKEMMPDSYPVHKIHSIEIDNGQILFADEILELLQNDHQNLSSI